MEAARRSRLSLSRRRPPTGVGSPGAALSARPRKASPWEPRPSPGRPSRRPRGEAGTRATPTGCSASSWGARGPPPGLSNDTPRPSPAGPPAPRSSRPWRGRRHCRAAPCARPTSPPGLQTSHEKTQRKPQCTFLSERRQCEKATRCVIPALGHSGTGKSHGDGKKISGRQGLVGRGHK
ncbi:Fanconi anemia core complex-associated protein 20 isoform X9 [Physeter macrocephalus]|uniref:Fanconi anemia core complex-associated protein 20 isoform X9 n=2 Tax=Physeter macrocephalus TaxID=9755 RepID=A0A455B5C0_PHYMC|nr:Fanconi anemia core complex-associated protein 20 isoform X9 [Physeter catodon]|eukprot:XP_028343784.1 Fanconi anemia core complex-associated protein 20 isoform X8 [Physeter catodon]